MLQSRSISGRPLSGRVIDGRALGMRGTSTGGGSSLPSNAELREDGSFELREDGSFELREDGALIPDAPVLTWVSDETVNPPILTAAFDGTKVWSAGQIDASNFDRIELQVDDDVAFGSPDDATNDVDAAELGAGEVDLAISAQATGIPLYARSRHIHYVAGVPQTSAWSNIETKRVFNAEVSAWINAVIGDGGSVTIARGTLVDNLVKTLKDGGAWTTIDQLGLLAAENVKSELRDIKAAVALTAVNSPTFTADQGHTGNGTSSYINTGVVPSAGGINFTQNSGAFGVYIRTARATGNNYCDIGTQALATHFACLYPRNPSDLMFDDVNQTTAPSAANTTVQGNWVVSRTSSTAVQTRRNEALVRTYSGTSSGLSTRSFLVGAINAGTIGDFSTDQIASYFISGGLTTVQMDLIANAINTYMTAIGANVY